MEGFAIGCVIGAAQAVVGHPLDTIMVQQQSGKNHRYTFRNLYRGMTTPFLTYGAYNSTLFGVYTNLISNPNLGNPWVAGAIAGAFGGPVLCICDAIKIRAQTHSRMPLNIFRGMWVTVALEVPATSVYFGVYSYMIASWNPFISGAVSGMAAWLSVYPLDVIKTRVQTDHISYRQAIARGRFFVGVVPCIARGGIINAVSFAIYSYLM